jgi:multidrug efflux pump subunit AcrB
MSRFAIRTPYFIVVVCLIIAVVGATSLERMPVDMFPAMNIPVVVEATYYSGMPPEQISGTESHAPLARAMWGGMSVSVAVTVIMVPAAYYVPYRIDDLQPQEGPLSV